MAWLLDTCVLSEVLKPRPEKRVVRWLEAVPETDLRVSVLTIGEIEKGIAKLRPSKRRDELERWAREHLLARFERRVLPIDDDIARTWGRLAGAAERNGAPLPVIDALLAATAIAHELTVVTRNVRHIERAGARVHDPWSA